MRYIVNIIVLVTLLSSSGCGYFLHPERVGQRSGNIDPTIVVLDAAGLLFGILPGVVAFAVDITTGAVYLAPGEKSSIDKHTKRLTQIDRLKLIPVTATDRSINKQQIAETLALLIGVSVDAEAIQYFKSEGTAPVVFAAREDNNRIL